jgi:hypothetical protein
MGSPFVMAHSWVTLNRPSDDSEACTADGGEGLYAKERRQFRAISR